MSFVGGWREDTFGRATRIRALPKDAARMRRIFTTTSE